MTRKWLDNVLLKLLGDCNGHLITKFSYKFRKGKYPRISEYLRNRFDNFATYSETYARLKLGINIHPKCKYCGKLTKYGGWKLLKKTGSLYNKFCCERCANIYNIDNVKETCKKKYGTISVSQTKWFRDKVIKTNVSKFGVDTPLRLKENIIKSHSKEIQKKKDITKQKNNTFNSSKSEDQLYKMLCDKYGSLDIERQHKESRYPFCCDFYIKSLDTFIELQGMWTHGGHPYNPDFIQDKVKLEKWKSKNTKFYSNAIKVWTISDPIKRKIAKQNNLKYIEVFDLDFKILYEISIL